MLNKTFIEEKDGFKWYNIESDTEGKAVLQKETGAIYGAVCMRDDDPHTYEECDDPNYTEESNEDKIRRLEEEIARLKGE